jgi:hypothetical protein
MAPRLARVPGGALHGRGASWAVSGGVRSLGFPWPPSDHWLAGRRRIAWHGVGASAPAALGRWRCLARVLFRCTGDRVAGSERRLGSVEVSLPEAGADGYGAGGVSWASRFAAWEIASHGMRHDWRAAGLVLCHLAIVGAPGGTARLSARRQNESHGAHRSRGVCIRVRVSGRKAIRSVPRTLYWPVPRTSYKHDSCGLRALVLPPC